MPINGGNSFIEAKKSGLLRVFLALDGVVNKNGVLGHGLKDLCPKKCKSMGLAQSL